MMSNKVCKHCGSVEFICKSYASHKYDPVPAPGFTPIGIFIKGKLVKFKDKSSC